MADCNLRNIEVELGQKLDQTAIIWLSLPSFCPHSLCSQAIKAKILIAWLTPVCHKSQTHCQPIRSQNWGSGTNERLATSTKCREMHQWQKHFPLRQKLNEWKALYYVWYGSNLCAYLLRRTMKNIRAAYLLTALFKSREEEPKSFVLFSRSRSHFMLSPSCHQPRRPGDSRRNIVPISGTGQKYSISFETMFRFRAWAAFWEKRMSVKLSIWRFKTIIRIVSSHNPHVLLRIHSQNLLFGQI